MADAADTFSFRGRAIATQDAASIRVGILTAFAFHVLLVVLAEWEVVSRVLFHLLVLIICSISPTRKICFMHPGAATTQTTPPAPDEEIIEGALLQQGGGGEYDPRRMIHRLTPILAETRAPATGLAKNQNHPVDAGTRVDPTAIVSQREILGRGNQDLAERLQRLAEAESENVPNVPPGLGSPDGSVNGTETDPNRAGHGAQAKIRSFLQRQLHLLATAPAAAHRPFRIRIVISSDGSYIAHGQIVQGSGDETTDSDLSVQIAQLGENQTPIPELTDDEKQAIAGHTYVVRYQPD